MYFPYFLLYFSLFLFGGDILEELKHIKKYILFLKQNQNLYVSIHSKNFDPIINSSTLSPFNIHDNSYCTTIKTKNDAYKNCINCQIKTIEKCNNGPFYGTCYAGVSEYVYPIFKKEECVGFISVSGYKALNSDSYQKRICEKYGFNFKELKNFYSTLKEDECNKEYIDTLIFPLCVMLESAISKHNDTPTVSYSLPIKIEQYLRQHRNQNITSADICEAFSCSRSYMSTVFNKQYGKTIREYINELRLKDAKSLLKYSELNITEIAFSVGFTDANYFSNLFKKQNKISPTQYRKKSRK